MDDENSAHLLLLKVAVGMWAFRKVNDDDDDADSHADGNDWIDGDGAAAG